MARSKNPQSPREKLEKSLEKAAGQAVVDAINSSDFDELRDRLVRLCKEEAETSEHMKENEDLHEAKERVKFLQEPYREAKKSIKLQRELVAARMGEIGTPAQEEAA